MRPEELPSWAAGAALRLGRPQEARLTLEAAEQGRRSAAVLDALRACERGARAGGDPWAEALAVEEATARLRGRPWSPELPPPF